MPLPNEHSCRLQSPNKYDEWARENCKVKHDGKCIDFIYGIKEGKSELQAMRYRKSIWTEDSARNHCKKKGGKFHPADKEKSKNLQGGEEMKGLTHYENLEFDIPIIVKRCYTVKKKDGEESDWIIEGYASMTGADRNEPIIEISKEAMKNSEDDLKTNSTVFLNHDTDTPVGKVLDSKVDKKGLWVKILISKTAKIVWQQIKEGVMNGLSIGARILESVKKIDEKIGKIIELITKMEIVEVSLVGIPAHPDTKIVSYKEEALMPICNYIYKNLQRHKIEDIDEEGGDKEMSKKEIKKEGKELIEVVREATADLEIGEEKVVAITEAIEKETIKPKELKEEKTEETKEKKEEEKSAEEKKEEPKKEGEEKKEEKTEEKKKPSEEKKGEGEGIEKKLEEKMDIKLGIYTKDMKEVKKTLDDLSKKIMTLEKVEEIVKKVIKEIPEPENLRKGLELGEEEEENPEKNLSPGKKLSKHISEDINRVKK